MSELRRQKEGEIESVRQYVVSTAHLIVLWGFTYHVWHCVWLSRHCRCQRQCISNTISCTFPVQGPRRGGRWIRLIEGGSESLVVALTMIICMSGLKSHHMIICMSGWKNTYYDDLYVRNENTSYGHLYVRIENTSMDCCHDVGGSLWVGWSCHSHRAVYRCCSRLRVQVKHTGFCTSSQRTVLCVYNGLLRARLSSE